MYRERVLIIRVYQLSAVVMARPLSRHWGNIITIDLHYIAGSIRTSSLPCSQSLLSLCSNFLLIVVYHPTENVGSKSMTVVTSSLFSWKFPV